MNQLEQAECDRIMSYLLPNHDFSTCRVKQVQDCKVVLRRQGHKDTGYVSAETFANLIRRLVKQLEICTALNILLSEDMTSFRHLGLRVHTLYQIRNNLNTSVDVHSNSNLYVTLKNHSSANLFKALVEIFEFISTLEIDNPQMDEDMQHAISLWNLMIKKLTQDTSYKLWLAQQICGVAVDNGMNNRVKDYHFSTGYIRMVTALKIRVKQIESDFNHILLTSSAGIGLGSVGSGIGYMKIPYITVENLVCPENMITIPFIPMTT